jgi:DNA-binding HxlR family transcriptional regulator
VLTLPFACGFACFFTPSLPAWAWRYGGSPGEAVIHLNRDGLHEFASILGHRWDRIILGLLVDGAMRRRDLTQLVRNDDGDHISDGVLSEALNRLEDEGLIEKTKTGANRAVYSATEEARRKIEQLRQIDEFAATLRGNDTDDST